MIVSELAAEIAAKDLNRSEIKTLTAEFLRKGGVVTDLDANPMETHRQSAAFRISRARFAKLLGQIPEGAEHALRQCDPLETVTLTAVAALFQRSATTLKQSTVGQPVAFQPGCRGRPTLYRVRDVLVFIDRIRKRASE